MKKAGIILTVMLILIFSFNSVFAAKYKGDMNGDNKRDIIDVRLLLQEYINKDNKKSAEEMKVRDMNGDSVIDILDVRLLLQQYINKDPLEEIPPEVVAVKSVALNKTSLTLTVGESATLKATLSPTDATNKKLTWSSSDKAVATVSSSGKVTAVKAGTATITVKTADGNKTTTCKVAINNVETEIKIPIPIFKDKKYNTEEQSIEAGTGYTLSGTTKATNAGTYTAKATLLNGYVWDDGTKTAKEITWKIAKIKTTISLAPNYPLNDEFAMDEDVVGKVNYSYLGDGIISVKSSDTLIATAKVNTTGQYIIIRTLRPGTTTITVTVAAGTNYSKTIKEFTVISNRVQKGVYDNQYVGEKRKTYSDSSIKVTIEERKGFYIAKIWVRDPEKQLKKTDLKDLGVWGKDLKKVEDFMKGKSNAIIACNGSGFSHPIYWPSDYGENYQPGGNLIITNGNIRRERTTTKKDTLLGILEDGSLQIFISATYDTIKSAGTKNTIKFGGVGNALIVDGEPAVLTGDAATSRAPRTAFGQIDRNNYVIIVANARRGDNAETNYQSRNALINIGKALNCKNLYNCDGGGSSTLWFNGKTFHHSQIITDRVVTGDDRFTYGPRAVSDCIYFISTEK